MNKDQIAEGLSRYVELEKKQRETIESIGNTIATQFQLLSNLDPEMAISVAEQLYDYKEALEDLALQHTAARKKLKSKFKDNFVYEEEA